MSNFCSMKITRTLAAAVAAFVFLSAYPGNKEEVFIPMDYSTCGYHASEEAIPYVRNAVRVSASGGDSYARIQHAIDYVAAIEPDDGGHRGAVLLDADTFYISRPLRISASGVVLRGAGKDKTVIVKKGVERGALIYIEGGKNLVAGDTIDISGDVEAGAVTLTLAKPMPGSIDGDTAGNRVMILRPCTKEWIEALGMKVFGGGIDYTGWKATDIDLVWHREVVRAEGQGITLDAPVTCSIEAEYGGGKVVVGYNEGEITECGVENLTLMSEKNAWNAMDEDHCWDGIWMDGVRDCWIRAVDFKHFAGSAVNINKLSRRITVEDCVASEPVSEIGGWRRAVFLTRGEQTLVQRCVSRNGIHDFAAGYCAAGPNAFVQCEGEEAFGFSGSIGSWAPGLLFDIVDIDGNDIKFANLEQFQFGTGWNTANSMMWQCTASTLWCYSPDGRNRNSANGCWGTFTGDGEWTSCNNHVKPRSLFYDQLSKRMGGSALDGYILPRDVGASSNPPVEQAARMAYTARTKPRLTMEMWIDTVLAVKAEEAQKERKGEKKLLTLDEDVTGPGGVGSGTRNEYSLRNGRLAVNGKLITGNRYQIPWWSGRTKDNFVERGAKPAVTRFVPGREGTGLTDRIDSVVNYLKSNGYCMLDHNYGLWYDLRRTDHERIRRADGDVWAPFYEQPFTRTGTGKAWDGLSLYDVTKPNLWYWARLKEYADKGAAEGLLLFHQNYFQHNILEAGAHWVDCPWRPVNNVNGTAFPEPVPFTGDKRIFMADVFYDETDKANAPLHKQYIRQCLDNFKDNGNVVQLISEEYTGPTHFVRFWLETIAEWEEETGNHPLIALSCTKDAQDSILADPSLSKVVDIIDIRYWHYNTDSLWAPPAGRNLSPRQFSRRMKPGSTHEEEAYRAVKEYRAAFPDKAVTFYAQQYDSYGWAILMAGGSLPNVKINSDKLLADICLMNPVDASGCYAMGDSAVGYVVYVKADGASIEVSPGTYNIYSVDEVSGDVESVAEAVRIDGAYSLNRGISWLESTASE